MTKSDNERLSVAVDDLAAEIHLLRDSIDEFRSQLQWGLQNDKFQSKPEPSESTQDLAAVVEATIRDEMSAVEDSLNDFSLDVQWAVRQIREASETVKTQLLLFRDDE